MPSFTTQPAAGAPPRPNCAHLHSVQGPGCPWCRYATDWRDQAACAYSDPDLWHPDPWRSTRPAKTICGTCSVRPDCLAYALAAGERWGVWGGLDAGERAALVFGGAA